MTKEEMLEVLNRVARDKKKGTQGVIIIVAQDYERGFDMTASTIGLNNEGAILCLKKLLEKLETGKVNGLIVNGHG